jgi:hypothetical protein
MQNKPVLLIDSNQYINLYGLVAGRKLLDTLEEQRSHIFIPKQIVDEVYRNKLHKAQLFVADKFKDIEALNSVLPDHLFSISDEKTAKFRKSLGEAASAKEELMLLAAETLAQISRSEDEVSQRLKVLFDKPRSPSDKELGRARDRRERGNPPGKHDGPLGDQIIWEQLLTHCKGGARLWIITSDKDYFTQHEKKKLLNPLLHRDIADACGEPVEIRCFDKLNAGLTDFAANAGVKAEKLPTDAESEQIDSEIESLPQEGWIMGASGGTMSPTLFSAAQTDFADSFAGMIAATKAYQAARESPSRFGGMLETMKTHPISPSALRLAEALNTQARPIGGSRSDEAAPTSGE